MSDEQLVEEPNTHQQDFQSDTKKIAAGAGIFIGGGMLGRAFLVLGQIFMARVLTLEAFGLYSLGWTILSIMAILTTFGMHVGLVRFGTPFYKAKDHNGLKNIIAQTFTISFVGSSFISLIIFFLANWISQVVFDEPSFAAILRIIAVGIPFASLLTVTTSATRLTQSNRYDVISQQFGRPFVHFVLVIIFYLAGLKLLGMAGAAVLSFMFAVSLNFYYINRLFPEMIKAKRTTGFLNQELLALSIPATMIGTVNFVNARIDRLMIGYFSVVEDVAIYQAISQIVIVFMIIQMAFITILAPMIADFLHSAQHQRLQQIYLMGNKWALYISLPFFALILIVPNEIISLLFGSKYAGNSTILIILAIAELFNLSTGAVSTIMFMSGRERPYLWISLIAFAINITLNILFIPLWGTTGAAIATGTGTIILFSLVVLDVKRALNLFPYAKRFLKGLTAISLASIVGYSLNSGLDLKPLFEVPLLGLCIGIIYLVCLPIFGLDEEDVVLLRSVTERIQKSYRKSKQV